MNSRSLLILLATSDRCLLRSLSKCLTAFGYEVVQASSAEIMARAMPPIPDFLVVDRKLAHQLPEDWREAADAGSRPYALCIVDGEDEDECKWLIGHGFDDLLRSPLVFGELLARLRTGARILEVDSRVAGQATRDSLTYLSPRSRFVDASETLLEQAQRARAPVSCVVIDVDQLGRINWGRGHFTGDKVLRGLGALLLEQCSEKTAMCRWESDRFCVLLPNRTESEAADWADRFRQSLREARFAEDLAVTASFGVAEWKGLAESCHELVRRGLQATRVAKLQGRDQVVREADPEQSSRGHLDLAVPSKLFASTQARDVMTPLATGIKTNQPMELAASILRNCRLPILAVLDDHDRLVGDLDADAVANWESSSSGEGQLAEKWMRPKPTCFLETASFQEIMDYFSAANRSHAFVVAAGRPVGFVTRDSVVALSFPIKTDTFADRENRNALSLDYLVVPDLTPVGLK